MDRPELRFKMLLEYYKEGHGIDGMKRGDADDRIQEIDISDAEKTAAQIWLIDSSYVVGDMDYLDFGPMPFISRINSRGVNFIEYIMDVAFVKINTKIPNISSLSVIEKIQKFVKECSEHPVTSEIGRIILDAVIRTMTELLR